MESLVEIGPVVLEKKMKMWKVYNNDNANDNKDANDNNGQILIRKAHLSLWLRWAKKFMHTAQMAVALALWAFGTEELKTVYMYTYILAMRTIASLSSPKTTTIPQDAAEGNSLLLREMINELFSE